MIMTKENIQQGEYFVMINGDYDFLEYLRETFNVGIVTKSHDNYKTITCVGLGKQCFGWMDDNGSYYKGIGGTELFSYNFNYNNYEIY